MPARNALTNKPDSAMSRAFLLAGEMDNKQEEQVLPEVRLWLWCVKDAIKTDDWDWIESMPDAFYAALRIPRPERPEEENPYPYGMAPGCWVTEAVYYE